MTKSFSVPGTAWVALIALVSGWLTQYFGEFAWTSTAIIVLGAIAKLIEINAPTPEAPPGALGAPMPQRQGSKVMRWLAG